MPDTIEEYKLLLQKKSEAATSLATSKALRDEKQKELEQLKVTAKEKFGVESLEELQKLKSETEAAMAQTVANIRASAPSLLNEAPAAPVVAAAPPPPVA